MSDYNFIIDIESRRLIADYFSTEAGTPPTVIFGDQPTVNVQLVESNNDNAENPWKSVDLTGQSIRIGVGSLEDATPSAYIELTADLAAASSVITEVRAGVLNTTNEIQRVQILDAVKGNYTITIAGETTTPLCLDASLEEITDAIEALASITADSVDVTGNPTDYRVEFDSSLADVGAITVNLDNITSRVGKTGTLDLHVEEILTLLDDETSVEATLEVVRWTTADVAGETVLQVPVTVKQDVIPDTVPSTTPLPGYATIDLDHINQSGAVTGQIPQWNGSEWEAATVSGTGDLLSTANLSDLADIPTARTNLGLGTAATTAATDYATSAQGDKADSASQPGHTHVASTDLVATGTPSASTFLRGDDVWATPAGGGDLSASDIDTLAELNAIVTDATLIDTADARLSDSRTPTVHAASHTDGTDDIQDATNAVKGLATAAHITAIEANNAKVSNATHTGEVTGSTALTIANRTGLDAGVVTGTAGTADNVSKWNADGDLVDSALVEARVINSMGTGLVEGGVLSINADTSKFDLSAGHGVVIDETDPDAPIVYNVAWGAFTAQTVTNLATDSATYISIDSAGAIVQSTAAPVASDGQLKIFLGQLGHSNNTSISATVIAPTIFNNGTNLIRAISETLGVLGTGNEVSANGANLSIDKAVGTLVKEGINFEAGNTARHTKPMAAQVLATIRRRTQTGGSGTATTIDPANYDVAGTVTAVPTNKYTNQRVYLVSSGNIVVQYGQTVHNSLSEAVSEINSESFVLLSNLEENAKLIGVISVKNNATDLTNAAQATFSKVDSIAAPSGAGVSDHGGLTGLADDDHTQYSLITSQAGAPSSTPTRVGEVNVDLTNDDVYISADTTGSGDWKLTTGAGNVVAELGIAVSDETTALTTGTAKGTFRMPYAMTVTDVRATVTSAPTGSNIIVDINDGVTSIMAVNKLSIDATEKTSTTAATAPGVTDTALADDAEITIDIDQIGSTIAGAGLKIWIIGTRA